MVSEPGSEERMYRRLEVGPEASAQEIRSAYRRLAHEMHPDAKPQDPEATRHFQEIAEAYRILNSPERRAAYDHQRRRRVRPTGERPGHHASPGMSGTPDQAGIDVPTVIGAQVFPIGSAPLAAGPVHVVSAGEPSDPRMSNPDGGRGLLIEAIWSWWELD